MGMLLGALTALSYSMVAIFVRRGVRAGEAENGVLIGLICNVMLLGTVAAWRWLGGVRVDATTQGIIGFVAAGLLTVWLARAAHYGGIRHIGPGRASAIKNLNPFVTVTLAFLFLGERFPLQAGVGATIALGGYALLVHERLRTSTAPVAVPAGGAGPQSPAGTSTLRLPTRLRSSIVVGYLAASGAALFFGAGQTVRKWGIEGMPDPYVGAFVSAAAGLTAYLLVVRARGRFRATLGSSLTTGRRHFWYAGVASSVGQLSFFVAITFAPVSQVSIVAASDTILTVLLGALLYRETERTSRQLVTAAVAVFTGAVVLALA